MGVSTRELYLILRARDEASRVLNNAVRNMDGLGTASQKAAQKHIAQGQALMTIGAGAAFAGAAGLKFFNEMANAAGDYDTQARRALTQTDNIGASLDQLKQIGRDVASAIPAPFEEMQGALYDIFSSMDVNVNDAKKLLTEFSKASVAGQVDLQTAAKGTITIMNAWQMPATNVNKVNDVMFQLVRKGVGTYDDFSRAIGRAIPSTVRAGGSIQDLAGMMAFMTRNGLSTAQAATSAARAFDAMSHPKTAKHMKEIGVSVRDANGNFRPMVDIMGDLNAKLGEMSAPQRSKVLYELFKGSGGTIQARRFFDLAIPGFKELKQRTDEMVNSKGAMAEAYKIMLDSPQAKLQALTNKWEILKTVIGDQILPIKMKLVDVVSSLMDKFNNLSPAIQKVIVVGGIIASVLAVVLGVVAAVAGGILMFMAVASAAGVALGTVAGVIAGVVSGIGILIGVIILVIKYWDQITAVVQVFWTVIQPIVMAVVDFIMKLYSALVEILWPAWQTIWVQIQNLIGSVQQQFQAFIAWLLPAWQSIEQAFANSWIPGFFNALWTSITTLLLPAFGFIVTTIGIVANVLMSVLGPAISFIIDVITNMVKIITGIIQVFLGVITGNWKLAWEGVKNIFSGIWGIITSLARNLFKALLGIVQSVVEGIVRFFEWLFDVLVGHSIVPDLVNAIVRWFTGLPGKVLGAIASLVQKVAQVFVKMFTAGVQAVKTGIGNVINLVKTLPGKIVGAIPSPGALLKGVGGKIMDGLKAGIKSGIDGVKNMLGSVTGMIPDWKGPAELDAKLLTPNGKMIMRSLIQGFQKEIPNVRNTLKNLTNEIPSEFNVNGTASGYSGGAGNGQTINTGNTVNVQLTVHTQEIDPRKHAADLGWVVAGQLSTSR